MQACLRTTQCPVQCLVLAQRRQDKTLDEVSAAILGDAVAENASITGRQAPFIADPVDAFVGQVVFLLLFSYVRAYPDAHGRNTAAMALFRQQDAHPPSYQDCHVPPT